MSEVTRYSCVVQVPRKSAPTGTSSMMMVEMAMVPASDYDQIKAENERLKEEVRSWVIRIQQRGLEMDELSDERDTLRKQMAEARELLDLVRDTVNDAANDAKRDTRKMIYQGQVLKIDAWLEANKP